jgi:hypothetical protein
MKRDVTVEALSELGNFAVVRLPGRRYPGIVVQGDSLWSLRCQAHELRTRLASGASQDMAEEVELLCEALDAIGEHYERSLKENGIELPYSTTVKG